MSRKLRALELADFTTLSEACGCCQFWESERRLARRCGGDCDSEAQAEWYHRVIQEWGDCGRVAYDDEGLLGLIKYAPAGYFPQAFTFPSAPTEPEVPMIACMHVSADARHRGLGTLLLRAALRDLVTRGERKVVAFGSAQKPAVPDDSPMLGVDFLIRNGFTVLRPDPDYPLLQLELRSLAVITENLEAVLQSLRLPVRMPERAPIPW